jgi:hypothetical protein
MGRSSVRPMLGFPPVLHDFGVISPLVVQAVEISSGQWFGPCYLPLNIAKSLLNPTDLRLSICSTRRSCEGAILGTSAGLPLLAVPAGSGGDL